MRKETVIIHRTIWKEKEIGALVKAKIQMSLNIMTIVKFQKIQLR
jgi:hypothetical protein